MDEKEAALLKKRLCELDNRSRQGGFALYSDFLDLYGQDIFWSLKLRDAHLLGGYDGAERKVACFCGDSPPLCFVKIAPKNKKFAAAMSHRDILGSLMGLGRSFALKRWRILSSKTSRASEGRRWSVPFLTAGISHRKKSRSRKRFSPLPFAPTPLSPPFTGCRGARRRGLLRRKRFLFRGAW